MKLSFFSSNDIYGISQKKEEGKNRITVLNNLSPGRKYSAHDFDELADFLAERLGNNNKSVSSDLASGSKKWARKGCGHAGGKCSGLYHPAGEPTTYAK